MNAYIKVFLYIFVHTYILNTIQLSIISTKSCSGLPYDSGTGQIYKPAARSPLCWSSFSSRKKFFENLAPPLMEVNY